MGPMELPLTKSLIIKIKILEVVFETMINTVVPEDHYYTVLPCLTAKFGIRIQPPPPLRIQ